MSGTMTLTKISEPPLTVSMSTPSEMSALGGAASCACPNCGLSMPPLADAHTALLQAQRQIEDLQAQVQILNEKAAAAVDRYADYEDELRALRAASTTTAGSINKNAGHNQAADARPYTPTNSNPASSPRSSFLGAGASRISQLLSPRKSVPNLGSGAKSTSHLASSSPEQQQQQQSQANSSGRSPDELLSALSREKELREKAEVKLDDTSKEVEELSATLFEEANKMVASERKARARLEERVATLERRDDEKRGRLDRLESAVGRLERVNRVLGREGGEDRDDE